MLKFREDLLEYQFQMTWASSKQKARGTVLCHTCVDSPVVSIFEQNENILLHSNSLVSLSSCRWCAMRCVAY